MSTETHSPPPSTRRERRAQERARAAPARRRAAASSSRGPSPILWITALVVVAGLVVVGSLFLLQRGSTGTVDASGLIEPGTKTPLALADGRSIGKAAAPVTLELWSDFQCPVCDQFARTVEAVLIDKYVTPGTLRIVHHDAAFQGARSGSAYDESVEAGAGARCAAEQDLYWPFHDWTFANQAGENKGAFADARLRAIATAAGLDVTAWDACRATGKQQTAVRAETTQALANGVNATPTMTINGQKIEGIRSAAELGAVIEAAAAAAAG